jgi:hypothetical protein
MNVLLAELHRGGAILKCLKETASRDQWSLIITMAANSSISSTSSSIIIPSASITDYLLSTVGSLPADSYSWLYSCRGLYELAHYDLCIEGLSLYCMRSSNSQILAQAQHLLAHALYQQKQYSAALKAFKQSVEIGNDTDWQMIVEIILQQKLLKEQKQNSLGNGSK